MQRQRRLSVALVTETYLPEVNGVAMTLGRLTEGLLARGHRLGVIRPKQKNELVGRLNDRLLLTPGLPIPGYPQLRFGLPVTNTLWSHWCISRPDIIHIATEGPLGIAALSVARKLNIPTISTFHTNFHRYSRHYHIGWLQGRIESYLRWFHNRTAATLVPTPELAMELAERGFGNVCVLSRGVDTALFNPGRRTSVLRQTWSAQENDPVFLVVSRIAPEKNLVLAMRAFSEIRKLHPRARMVCVGDGPLKKSLSEQYPACQFIGERYGTELAEHFASADLFIFPSLTETYGNVVAEALASGLPVVAYDRAAATQLIKNRQNGLRVPPGNELAFIQAACEIANNMPQSTISRQLISASVAHLKWECIHSAYEDILHSVLNGPVAYGSSKDQAHFALD